MAVYVFDTTSGALVSYCPNDTDPVAANQVLTAAGLSVVTGLPPLGPTVAWNAGAKTTNTVVAPAVPVYITTVAWLLRFTPAEFTDISASNDAMTLQALNA